jgi:hypothetical protein
MKEEQERRLSPGDWHLWRYMILLSLFQIWINQLTVFQHPEF